MKKMSNEEYVKWAEENGFWVPQFLCSKCGNLDYFFCTECNPDFLKNRIITDDRIEKK
jgi:hypothetical protein